MALASLWFLSLHSQAQQGQPKAYRRLKLLSTIIPIGILLIILAPDNGYPTWMKWEQGGVGLLLVGVALTLYQQQVAQVFGKGRR